MYKKGFAPCAFEQKILSKISIRQLDKQTKDVIKAALGLSPLSSVTLSKAAALAINFRSGDLFTLLTVLPYLI